MGQNNGASQAEYKLATSIAGQVPGVVNMSLDASGNPQAVQSPTGAYRRFWPANTTPDAVKATPGRILKIVAVNSAASARYLKLWNLATANVTVGTTVPSKTFLLPAGSTTPLDWGVAGLTFSTAIAASVTTGVLDTDVAAPTANDVLLQVDYV
jgi:hypothetical protein